MLEICPKTLAAVGVISICAVESVALIMGHNGQFFNLAIGAVVAITTGVPLASNWASQKAKTTFQVTEPKEKP